MVGVRGISGERLRGEMGGWTPRRGKCRRGALNPIHPWMVMVRVAFVRVVANRFGGDGNAEADWAFGE